MTNMTRFQEFIPIVKPLTAGFDDLAPGITEIMESGILTKGSKLKAMEESMARSLRVKHAIGVSSCTSGLMLSFIGLGLEGEVIFPSFTFLATAAAAYRCGLKPVFADIDPRTANIDPDSVEKVITPDTCAIIAVHNFGNPADIEALERIALDHGMPLIFDSAHGFGSLYRGEPLGAQGSVQVFSMSPTKLLVAGEGGIVATNDDELAHMVRMGRDYGMGEGYDSQFAGLNARLPEISALMALHGLNNLEQSVKRRNEIAGVYRSRLAEIPGLGFQQIDPENRSSYKDFTIFIDEGLFGVSRDTLSKELRYRNIDTRAYYNPPVHKQTAYKSFYKGEDLHHTEDLSNSALSVPIWSHMPDDVVEGVCDSILDIQANGAGDKKIQRDLS